MADFLKNRRQQQEQDQGPQPEDQLQENLQDEGQQPKPEVMVNEGPEGAEPPESPSGAAQNPSEQSSEPQNQMEDISVATEGEARAQELEGERQEGKWEPYDRRGTVEARPYEDGEDLSNISVREGITPKEGDMIARDIDNPDDQWLIDQDYFSKNYMPTFGVPEDEDKESIETLTEERDALRVKVQNQNRELQRLRANAQIGNR